MHGDQHILLREMDSFCFIEAWDAEVKESPTVPSVTTRMLIGDAVTGFDGSNTELKSGVRG
jgi:hypothetical protein